MAVEIVLQNPKVNEQAPAFSGIDSYGNTINLSDFIGQPVILEWTNHECPYVAKHYDENNRPFNLDERERAVSYTHLTLPTNREV